VIEFLRARAAQRFDWAAGNCLTLCADWIVARTGRDPAAGYRDVNTQEAGNALMRAHGGMLPFASSAMAVIGMPILADTQDAREGDVALVWAPIGKQGRRIVRRPTGALCLGDRDVAVLTVDRGLVVAPLSMLRAWRIGA
jgi:hypothetical protein